MNTRMPLLAALLLSVFAHFCDEASNNLDAWVQAHPLALWYAYAAFHGAMGHRIGQKI